MSAPIGPGDWVECVGPFNGAAGLAAAGAKVIGEYRVGMVALCEAVTPRMQLPDGAIVPGLKVREVKAFIAGREVWLAAYQWRPIYRPKADLIESLKAPPKRVSEPA